MNDKISRNNAPQPSAVRREDGQQWPLLRNNFFYMAIAGAFIIIGFLLMLGEASGEETYNPDIFSTRRIVIGPLITFIGFVGMAVAIIIKPKKA